MRYFLIQALISAVALWVADALIAGIHAESAVWLLITAIVLGLINAVVKPVAMVLTFPITIVTLGLFLLVLNAAMLALAGWIVPGFDIDGFWAAFWGAIIVSIVSWLTAALLAR